MKTSVKNLLIYRTLFKKNQDLSTTFLFNQKSDNPSEKNQVKSEILDSNDPETFSILVNSSSFSIEVVIEWIKEILPRPTPLTLIFTVLLYLVAICSTIQRQQGDRWLGVLLRAKMPGCTKVSQEFSWETFENITSQSTYTSNSWNRSMIDASHSSILGTHIDNSSNEYSNDNLQMTGSVTLNSSSSNIFEKDSVLTNTLITDIDVYKDQALIHLRSPWNKQLRKEFIGFFPEQGEIDTNLNAISLSKGKQITLKWYKISACNDSTRMILPTQEASKESSQLNTLVKLDTLQPPVRMILSKQLNSEEKLNPLFLSFNSQYGNTREVKVRSRETDIPEKILGLQYIFPFNKKAIYLESDSIPSKLDSPYLNSLYTHDSPKSFTNSNLVNFITTPKNRANDHDLRERFEKNLENAYGTDFLLFQNIVKEIFYSYGLNGPFNLDSVINQKLSELKEKDQYDFLDNVIAQNILEFKENDENEILSETDQGSNVKTSKNDKNPASHVLSNKKKKKTKPKSFSKEESKEFTHGANTSKEFIESGSGLIKPIDPEDKKDHDNCVPMFEISATDSERALQSSAVLKEEYGSDSNDPGPSYSENGYSIRGLSTKNQKENKDVQGIENDQLIDKFIDNVIKELDENLEDYTDFQKVFAVDFSENSLLSPRLMSGYKFPELTREETSSLFKEWIIAHLLMCSSISFTPGQLLNSILLSPLHINLPPTLPLSLIKNLAFPFIHSTPLSVLDPVTGNNWTTDSAKDGIDISSLPVGARPLNTSVYSAAELFNVDLQYRRIRLEELSQVKEIFAKFGRDYDDYLNRPTDSPPAIKISPSLEDDKLIEEEHKRIIKERELARLKKGEDEDEEKYDPTRFEDLQEIRENEKNFEKSKDFQRLAADNTLSYHSVTVNKDFPIEKNINSWIFSKVGHENMLSDRKYSFLGRMHFLSKKLVAQLQKDINENILHNGKSAPYDTNFNKPLSLTDRQKRVYRSLPLRALEARARKDLIDLLEAPDFSIHNSLGVPNRKYRPDIRLRLKRRYVPYSHLNWHKRKSRSTLLGLPTNRHVVMPEISVNQWKTIIESELKKYFLQEGKRLNELVKKDPDKTYKIKKIHVYLPWVTVRTPINKPFEWPLTRLDYTESPIPTQLDLVRLTNFGSCLTDGSEKLRIPKLLKNPSRIDLADFHFLENLKPLTFRFPKSQPVDYWGYRSYDTLSSSNNVEKATGNHLGKSNRNLEAGIRKKILNKQYLFEPITNQSYLFIYRLFLALALKEVLKYIYRITLKKFLLGIANSELGLQIMSPEFRSGLHHDPPKSFYKSCKLLRDVAGAQDANTIPLLSELIWSIRNRRRGCAIPRGVLVVGPSGTEKTSLIQAIAGEAEVPIIVESMRALTLTFNKPYERLQKIFKLARQQAPCVLFLDDLDAIGKSRFNVVNSDIGSNNSLLSLDPEMGSTKLRLAHISAGLQTDFLQKNSTRSTLSAALSSVDPLSTDENISNNASGLEEGPLDKTGIKENRSGTSSQEDNFTFTPSIQNQKSEGIKSHLVLHLLTELDGIKALNDVVIIATSEHPALLDPALLRPGRFDKRIYLQLPNHEKRIQLFKAETQKIGSANSMPWDYFGIRTANMSGIDILSVINHSAIRAILDDTVHTVETLEHGLNCVIGLPNKKIRSSSLQYTDPFHTSRLAFYQAGRGVVQSLLVEHPSVGFLSLTEPVATSVQGVLMSNSYFSQSKSETGTDRSSDSTQILSLPQKPRFFPIKFNGSRTKEEDTQEYTRQLFSDSLKTEKKYISSSTRTRIDLETRLVGLYGGKAGELLHLSANTFFQEKKSKNQANLTNYSKHLELRKQEKRGWLWQSNLGFSELLAASSLIHLMIDRWYLYSTKVFTLKCNQVRGSLNHEQIPNQKFLQIFQRVSKQLNSDKPKSAFWGNTDNNQHANLESVTGGRKFMPVLKSFQQDDKKAAWWQTKICQQLQISERSYGKWFRLYLPKLEQTTQNPEWLSSDTFFSKKLTVFNVSRKRSTTFPSVKSLNDLYQFERDRQYQNTVINCFYTAFNLLHDNRELLDLLADHLIRFKILRSYEIEKICSLYIQSRTL